ncbi:MAG: DUF4080 domain-containing protein [Lachnospirales bacterium]
MNKILLVGINAKFIHQNLAIHSIGKFLSSKGIDNIFYEEFTINSNVDKIINAIYMYNPKILGLSCYIWNFEIIKNMLPILKDILPNTKIILGGPEVSYEIEYSFLKEADYIVIGEGELPFYELVNSIFLEKDITTLKAIAYRKNDKIYVNKEQNVLNLEEIPFVYDDLSIFENKILYYETSRGCPYNCQYCLSSSVNGVRFLSEARVFSDLDFFIKNKVRQVKFVDRTFNIDTKFAMKVWEYLIKNDNMVTNFHFELSADILKDEMFTLLKKARTGLFQFEVGVQSTNEATLKAIQRSHNQSLLFENIKKLMALKNIHIHLDLIVGLPFEDIIIFEKSFNNVYRQKAEQFQIGFLKLLKGAGLRSQSFIEEYGFKYRNFAPYEIYETKWLPYKDYSILKDIEELVELYYNSGLLYNTLCMAMNFCESDFRFYIAFSKFFRENGYYDLSHKKLSLYTIFFDFINIFFKEQHHIDILKDLITLDFLLNEKASLLPETFGIVLKEGLWDILNDETLSLTLFKDYYEQGYTNKQLARNLVLVNFKYDIFKLMEDEILENNSNYIIDTFLFEGKFWKVE